jgi:hypothetical protein
MVEGGGRVIRSFLEGSLADRVVLTIAPLWLGGYSPFHMESTEPDSLLTTPLSSPLSSPLAFPLALESSIWERHGVDMVVRGRPYLPPRRD